MRRPGISALTGGMLVAALVASGAAALVLLGGRSAPARGQGPAAPAATTGPADSLHIHSARLSGSVDSNGVATSYRFQYGRTSAYGSSTPAVDAGAGFAPRPVAAALSGLAQGTTFHYRLVATNSLGTAAGADATFATRDPRIGGRYRVRLRILRGGRAFGQRRGTVVHRRYSFRPRCSGSLCRGLHLVRDGKRGRFRSTLRRARSGVYVGTERFHGGHCNDGLRFHTNAPVRIAVRRTSGDRASRIDGHLAIKLRGCARGFERARLRGRPHR
jgi:hypothetical protein